MTKKTKAAKTDPHLLREKQKYSTPIPSREFIIEVLQEAGEPLSFQQIIRHFDLKKAKSQDAMDYRLRAMLRDGQLMKDRRGHFALVAMLELVRGTVIGHKDGYGFLAVEGSANDIFIPPGKMRILFPGDMILARVTQTGRGRPEAIPVEILERKTKQIVGRFYKDKNIAYVSPDKKTIAQDIMIPQKYQHGAKSKQIVVVEILQPPTQRLPASGKIIEILGDELSAGMEAELAIRNHDIPHVFPDKVLAECEKWHKAKVKKAEIEGRKDLRELPLVTIDGEDAKDFDDAVYCEARKTGGWRLLVAIADVSHYVKINSALDHEAKLRGNSVYFPGRVIPMLPEVLSNELCSLNEAVDRLCMVCEMLVDNDGKMQRYQFHQAVIRSRARLTYTEVHAMLTGVQSSKMALLPHLQNLYELYLALHQQREKRGALDFETTETKIIFEKNGKIKKIIPTERNEAHKIIEECMLLANVAAAKFIRKNKIPALYRIHEGPSPEKLKKLHIFLQGAGLHLAGGEQPSSENYASLLKQIADRADAGIIQTILLRSLQQAVYDIKESGHFGLAYDAYAHFTSPIRRYPDLLVHRAIKFILSKAKKSEFTYHEQQMQEFAQHCSMTERRADTAVYEAIDALKCQFMLNKVGQTYTGIVTGVTAFGLFVELEKIYVEGLLHISALPRDYYEFDDVKHCLRAKKTGKIFSLGDELKVIVARVEIDAKEIDFELA